MAVRFPGLALIILAGAIQMHAGASGQIPSNERFLFREPAPAIYRVAPRPELAIQQEAAWIEAWPEEAPEETVQLGSRVVLQLKPGAALKPLIQGSPLQLARIVAPSVFILQAPNSWTALEEADRLARLPEVKACHPVMRRQRQLGGPYAPLPNDPFFTRQWHLENRDSMGNRLGADLNVRAAWPHTKGEGVVVAIVDDGFELDHPDLAARSATEFHFNFDTLEPDGNPQSIHHSHGTAVAGIVGAEKGNQTGIAGVAPRADLASWIIFTPGFSVFGNGFAVSDEQLMDMFQYKSNVVSVQNHSWGTADLGLSGPSLLEEIGISNAITHGRDGRGVIMVRAAGNDREFAKDANDDGYSSDPRVIAVGSVRSDGRATSYSNMGACLLVAAPSGDYFEGFPTIFTTDRQGTLGYNTAASADDLADYAFDETGFEGTSASAPQIAGLAALLLSINPDLTYRDVQQILIHSARHFDLDDPDLAPNAAGFLFSHNAGFGVPDAGFAVDLARNWKNRPPLTETTFQIEETVPIPEAGLRVWIDGDNVPLDLQTIPSWASQGPHPDSPTSSLPLVDVGLADGEITEDLTGKAALIRRGINFFSDKIERAAQAGAEFAIIYNNVGGNDLVLMGDTIYSRIPAVFIGQNDGENLREFLVQNPGTAARIQLEAVEFSFDVAETLLCEHIGVRVKTNHPQRGDLRITLLSPQGTRGILQRVNSDAKRGPIDWTYYSTRHFYESSAGTWSVHISDQVAGNTGDVQSVELIIRGVPITDTDRDGLDDDWELAHFGSLDWGPQDDPDADGFSNAREQIMGTDPAQSERPLKLHLSGWNDQRARLSWPAASHSLYRIEAGPDPSGPLQTLTTLPGQFPVTEWFLPYNDAGHRFFRVEAVPAED